MKKALAAWPWPAVSESGARGKIPENEGTREAAALPQPIESDPQATARSAGWCSLGTCLSGRGVGWAGVGGGGTMWPRHVDSQR